MNNVSFKGIAYTTLNADSKNDKKVILQQFDDAQLSDVQDKLSLSTQDLSDSDKNLLQDFLEKMGVDIGKVGGFVNNTFSGKLTVFNEDTFDTVVFLKETTKGYDDCKKVMDTFI